MAQCAQMPLHYASLDNADFTNANMEKGVLMEGSARFTRFDFANMLEFAVEFSDVTCAKFLSTDLFDADFDDLSNTLIGSEYMGSNWFYAAFPDTFNPELSMCTDYAPPPPLPP